MISAEDKKLLYSQSDTCPFCGIQLTKDNSEIDHIIPKSMGGTDEYNNLRLLCRKCNATKADKHDRLFEYYARLMKNKGITDDDASKKIDYMLRNMSERDLNALNDRVEKMDPAYKRLIAYATLMSKFQTEKTASDIEPSNDELAKNMESSLKSFANYDIDNEKRIQINGNTFLYEKDFPIEEYRETLSAIGEEEQNEIFTVYLDDGKLVVG